MCVHEEEEILIINDPTIQKELLDECPKDKLQQAMKEEMTMMRDFGVATEVDHTTMSTEYLHIALDFRFVHRWKGSTITSRLCIICYKQHVQYEDSVYASTPSQAH